MATNLGISEDSQNRSRKRTGYALSSLTRKSKPATAKDSQTNLYEGESGENTVKIRGASGAAPSDDDSQKGILRFDEFDVVVESAHGRI